MRSPKSPAFEKLVCNSICVWKIFGWPYLLNRKRLTQQILPSLPISARMNVPDLVGILKTDVRYRKIEMVAEVGVSKKAQMTLFRHNFKLSSGGFFNAYVVCNRLPSPIPHVRPILFYHVFCFRILPVWDDFCFCLGQFRI